MSDDRIDKLTAIMTDMLDGLEAIAVSGKKQLADIMQVSELPDFNQLAWVKKAGARGEYEQASRENSKVDIFDRLASELKAHHGFWQHMGYKFWFHGQNENVIDRRKA